MIMLTTFELDEYVLDALRAGASGFLLKDTPSDELVAAIRIIAAGEALLAPSVTRRLLDRVGSRLPMVSASQPAQFADLTDRETEVLRLVAKGLSNAEIAEPPVLSDATVKTHVSHILMNLDLRDRVQVVVLAYESGLVEPGSD